MKDIALKLDGRIGKADGGMKQHLSVLMLMARSTIYKILGVFFLMAAIQGGLFYTALNRVMAAETAGLELVFQQSRIIWVCALGFLLVTALLCLTGCESGGKQDYTLRRLSISEKSIFLWQTFYNTCCFFFFWIVQLFIVLALCLLYMKSIDTTAINDQAVFLAFYRSNFLHGLLPLDETSRYVRNAVLVFGLGITSAYFPLLQRRGKASLQVFILVAITLFYFPHNMGSLGTDILVIVLSLGLSASSLSGAFRRRDDDEN